MLLIKIQPDTTVCRYLFTAKSLYMYRVSQHPSSGVLKTVTAASGTGHNIDTATSLPQSRSGLQHGHYSNPAAPNLQHTTNREQNDRCGNSTAQSQAPDDGYINVRNMLST